MTTTTAFYCPTCGCDLLPGVDHAPGCRMGGLGTSEIAACTTREQVGRLLCVKARPTVPITAADLRSALESCGFGMTGQQAQSFLARAVQRGDLLRVAPGAYRATAWLAARWAIENAGRARLIDPLHRGATPAPHLAESLKQVPLREIP